MGALQRVDGVWIRALSQPIPQAWELRTEQETNAAAGEIDLVLEEKLDDANFEAEETSFASELMTMPAFSADKDDEERLKTYILQRVPPGLKSELDIYLLYRTETFAARRAGGAVQSISAEADQTALLRFFGWMERTNRPVVGDSITFMIRDDLGDIAQEYAQWLQNTQQCKFSTIANYTNGLVSITSYCYANLAPNDALLAMDPNPLTQLINLRGQAENLLWEAQFRPAGAAAKHLENIVLAREQGCDGNAHRALIILRLGRDRRLVRESSLRRPQQARTSARARMRHAHPRNRRSNASSKARHAPLCANRTPPVPLR